MHAHAGVCAGDGLRLQPSSMSVQERACMLPSEQIGGGSKGRRDDTV